MSDYTLAPAVSLVATSCAICSRELLDAVSVEAGVGPTCRARHGYDEAQGGPDWDAAWAAAGAAGITLADDADPRRAANALVHRVAARPGTPEVPALLVAVSALGFRRLAAAIATNLCPVVRVLRETTPADQYVVEVARGTLPDGAFEAFVDAMRTVPGRRWDGDRRVNVVPARRRAELWRALCGVLPAGTVIVGERVVALA